MELNELYKQYPLYSAMFDKQLMFALQPNRFKAAKCSRRAGKTKGIMLEIIQDGLIYPNSLMLYLALTDKSVQKITFPVVREIKEQFKLDLDIVGDEIVLNNGTIISCLGANHINKIENFRGTKLRACVVDEAASFRGEILNKLVDEVLTPALIDLKGKFILAGSPASHCSGLFYDVTTGTEPDWYTQSWTGFDNPFVAESFKEDAERYLKRKKVDETDSKYRRERLGEWCADTDSLMIKPFAVLPHLPTPYNIGNWSSVIGVDFGYNDKTAFTVICWQRDDRIAYILRSFGFTKLSVSEIEQHIKQLITMYRPQRIVGDPAGASKVIIEEFNKRGIPMEPAMKSEKAHYIEILNDALINSELVLIDEYTKELQDEMKKVVWNEDHTREHETAQCDCLDSTLYCFREVLAYLEKIPVKVNVTREIFEQNLLEEKIKHYTNLDKQTKLLDQIEGDLIYDLNTY